MYISIYTYCANEYVNLPTYLSIWSSINLVIYIYVPILFIYQPFLPLYLIEEENHDTGNKSKIMAVFSLDERIIFTFRFICCSDKVSCEGLDRLTIIALASSTLFTRTPHYVFFGISFTVTLKMGLPIKQREHWKVCLISFRESSPWPGGERVRAMDLWFDSLAIKRL